MPDVSREPGPQSGLAELRRNILDLFADGKSVAHDPEISEQTIYGWSRQDPYRSVALTVSEHR